MTQIQVVKGEGVWGGLLKELLLLEMVLLVLLCILLIEYSHKSRGYFAIDNSLVIFSDDINAEFLVSFSISKYCQNKHIRQCHRSSVNGSNS